MNKGKFTKILLLAFPLLVVLVASSPVGVTVFEAQQVTALSWLQTVPESPWGWCAPVAALMNYVVFGLAVCYALIKKPVFLKGIFILAFLAACMAVLPVMLQSEIKIIPNPLGAILLGVESITARIMLKADPAEQEKNPVGERLSPR